MNVEIFPQQSDFAIRTFGLPGGAGFEQALISEARSCLLYDPAEAVLDYLPSPIDVPGISIAAEEGEGGEEEAHLEYEVHRQSFQIDGDIDSLLTEADEEESE